MVVRKDIDINKPLSDDEKKMLERVDKMPIVYDEDSPELTPEQLTEFRRVSEMRNNERRKQTVTLRLSPSALSKAKSLGKGYTSVLARILEEALKDNDMIKRCL